MMLLFGHVIAAEYAGGNVTAYHYHIIGVYQVNSRSARNACRRCYVLGNSHAAPLGQSLKLYHTKTSVQFFIGICRGMELTGSAP